MGKNEHLIRLKDKKLERIYGNQIKKFIDLRTIISRSHYPVSTYNKSAADDLENMVTKT